VSGLFPSVTIRWSQVARVVRGDSLLVQTISAEVSYEPTNDLLTPYQTQTDYSPQSLHYNSRYNVILNGLDVREKDREKKKGQ